MKKMRKPLVYICGPYRIPDPVTNTAEAMQVGRQVRDDLDCVVCIPHLSLFEHLQKDGSDEYWLRVTMEQMRCCDAVYRYSKRFSSGADAEVAEAAKRGIPVFTSLPKLAAFIQKWKSRYERTVPAE